MVKIVVQLFKDYNNNNINELKNNELNSIFCISDMHLIVWQHSNYDFSINTTYRN